MRTCLESKLTPIQMRSVEQTLILILEDYTINESNATNTEHSNEELLTRFLSAKKVEGRSIKTLDYYESTIRRVVSSIPKSIPSITTDDLRNYLSHYQDSRKSSKNTIDNIRRILSSFYSWLEDEDLVLKSPVRRIHRVKTGRVVKETFSDEDLEMMRDCCTNQRDLAMIDLLSSTGIRVGELVNLNRSDLDLNERECIVCGKGDSQRIVYFDARSKLHLENYLSQRTDCDKALFVSLNEPHARMTIGAVESCLKRIGEASGVISVHPHKFRRTMATSAIGKGMPIEQVQRLLGHVRIDTTMHYAFVDQNNVKISHQKFVS